MAVDLISASVGGAIGLAGGLGGVLLGHFLTGRREARTRAIAGLQSVVAELNRMNRLALFFDQQINGAAGEADGASLARAVTQAPGWREATHELQEAQWRFPCIAYLPEVKPDFLELERLMLYIMDPSADGADGADEPNALSRSEAILQFQEVQAQALEKVEQALRTLV